MTFSKLSARQNEIHALAEAAKGGDAAAKQALRSFNLDVWTAEMVDGVNFYLKNRHTFQEDRYFSDQTLYVHRSSTHSINLATVVWLIPSTVKQDPRYFLTCLEYDDGALAYWLAYLHKGVIYPIVDITHWRNRNHEEFNRSVYKGSYPH